MITYVLPLADPSALAVYDQTQILTADGRLNATAYEEYGRPYFTSTYQLSIAAFNLSTGAAISHVALWYYKDMIAGWRRLRFRPRSNDDDLDIQDVHYQKMLVYPKVPLWWYAVLFLGK